MVVLVISYNCTSFLHSLVTKGKLVNKSHNSVQDSDTGLPQGLKTGLRRKGRSPDRNAHTLTGP